MSTLRSPNQAELPRPGEVVSGKYRVDAVIGAGGMGVVMGALDLSLGRPVAIKFLAPAKARREGAVARFLREARAAAAIQSEHVARVFEVGTTPAGAPFIVMEHLRGSDLAQIVAARGGLPVEEAVDYLLQACEALGEAHARGIVHRDLKPQNLFLTQRPDGSPCLKVLDFGISKAVDEGAPNLTSTDTVMGTPLYMSPEQVRSLKNVDQRADIWALGSILFELLTASPIYDAPSASALCAMIAMDPPTPLRARRPSAPAELEAVILRCLHKDPLGRYQDVAALAEALAPFATERGRLSATRISRVVRAGSNHVALAGSVPPHPAAAALVGTTADGSGRALVSAPPSPFGPSAYPPGPVGPSAYPPGPVGPSNYPPSPPLGGAPMAVGASAYPPGPGASGPGAAPPTQSTWQNTHTGTMTATREGRGASPVVVAMLGVLTGVAVLGLGAGAAYVVYTGRTAASEPVVEAVDAAPPTAPTSAVTSTPVTTATATAAVAPTSPTAPTPRRVDPPKIVADAGAPPGARDAGAPAPKPPAPKPASTVDEELEALKRIEQGRCDHASMLLRGNDPKNNLQAKQIKTMMCLQATTPNGVTCQRSVCRSACSMLQDQDCLRRLDYAERNYKPRF